MGGQPRDLIHIMYISPCALCNTGRQSNIPYDLGSGCESILTWRLSGQPKVCLTNSFFNRPVGLITLVSCLMRTMNAFNIVVSAVKMKIH